AHRHRAERAAVVALTPRDDAESLRIAALEPILACKLNSGFGGFGAARREIDAATVAEIRRGESKQPVGKLFGGKGMKLRRVRKSDLRCLLGHRAADLRDTVADADDGGLPRSVQQPATIGSENPGAFAANRDGQILLEISRKHSRRLSHEPKKL